MTLNFKTPSLPEARRHLRMNLSILEMLKGNTEPNDIAKIRQLWILPYEELIQELEERLDECEPRPLARGGRTGSMRGLEEASDRDTEREVV